MVASLIAVILPHHIWHAPETTRCVTQSDSSALTANGGRTGRQPFGDSADIHL